MCEGRKELSLKPQSKRLQKNVNCADCLYVLEAQSFWYEGLLNIWHLHISLHSFIFIFTRCTPCSLSRPSRHHATSVSRHGLPSVWNATLSHSWLIPFFL